MAEAGDRGAVRIVAVQVEGGVFAIGQEVDLAIEPERIEVGDPLAGDCGHGVFLRVENANRRRGAAAIAAPAGAAAEQAVVTGPEGEVGQPQLGRETCRERVCQYFYVTVVDVSFIKKKDKKNK